MKNTKRKVLIVVDYQKDFVDGALPVPGAAEIKSNIQKEIDSGEYENIIYTLDTHIPEDYRTSAEAELFPDHCFFNTPGWAFYGIKPKSKVIADQINNFELEFPINLNEGNEYVFMKNKFSIWEGNKDYAEWFTNFFDKNVEVVICGVATNYCVFMNAMGYSEKGFNNIFVIENATKGILDETYEENIEEMRKNGVTFI